MPVIFGIVIAAWSSVFIAAPILLVLGDWRRRRTAVPAVDAGALAGGTPAGGLPAVCGADGASPPVRP